MGRPVSSGCKKTTEVSLRGRYKGDIGLGGGSTPQEEPLRFFHDFHIGAYDVSWWRLCFERPCSSLVCFEACNTSLGVFFSGVSIVLFFLRISPLEMFDWKPMTLKSYCLTWGLTVLSLYSLSPSQFVINSDVHFRDGNFASTFLLIRGFSLTSRCPYRA